MTREDYREIMNLALEEGNAAVATLAALAGILETDEEVDV